MTDRADTLVERVRWYAKGWGDTKPFFAATMDEAAARILSLEAENARFREMAEGARGHSKHRGMDHMTDRMTTRVADAIANVQTMEGLLGDKLSSGELRAAARAALASLSDQGGAERADMTDTLLVERVAKALCRHDANKHGIWFDDDALNKHIFNNWRKFQDQARAALASLSDQGGDLREALLSEWTDFLDANPDDLTSPEEYPDHALVTFDQMLGMVSAALAQPSGSGSLTKGETE